MKQITSNINHNQESDGSLVEKENSYAIKENVQRTSWSTTWPATVTIRLASKGEKTDIPFNSSNFELGPIQSNECKSRLGAVKSTILAELNDYNNNQNVNAISSADEILSTRASLMQKLSPTKNLMQRKSNYLVYKNII